MIVGGDLAMMAGEPAFDRAMPGKDYDAIKAFKTKPPSEAPDGGAILIGGGGKDDLTGGKGNDLLIGGKGDDTFHSSKGKDVYFGGEGNDTFLITLDADGTYGGDREPLYKMSGGWRHDCPRG